MDDEKEKAFAHYDVIKAGLTRAHNEARRTGDPAVIEAVEDLHKAQGAAWTDYLAARGWQDEAASTARSGGEDKPDDKDGG